MGPHRTPIGAPKFVMFATRYSGPAPAAWQPHHYECPAETKRRLAGVRNHRPLWRLSRTDWEQAAAAG